jgi:hypothetical protein
MHIDVIAIGIGIIASLLHDQFTKDKGGDKP